MGILIAEHLQENLLRDFTVPPVVYKEETTEVPTLQKVEPKPWADLNAAEAEARYSTLRGTKSFLESQLESINQEMIHLRIYIMETKLGRVVRMAELNGLGTDGEPKTKLSPPQPDTIVLPVNPPGQAPIHFNKPYGV